MSIDFSTLQGLTIPEGVVTEIADSSGRVLWSAFRGCTFYLKPCADISIGHSLYPEDSPSAYLLINEEVHDGSTTYIKSPTLSSANWDTSEATSIFSLELNADAKIRKVNSAVLKYNAFRSGSGTADRSEFKLSVKVIDHNGSTVYEFTEDYSSAPNSYLQYTAPADELATAINSLIANNALHLLSGWTLELYSYSLMGGTGAKGTHDSCVSQAVFALECE